MSYSPELPQTPRQIIDAILEVSVAAGQAASTIAGTSGDQRELMVGALQSGFEKAGLVVVDVAPENYADNTQVDVRVGRKTGRTREQVLAARTLSKVIRATLLMRTIKESL